MLRTLRTTARAVHLRPLQSLQHQANILPLPALMQHARTYADKVVQVPQMAESISEGTLKQWSKQIGEFVEQDEEIATIETDKVRQPSFCPALAAPFPILPLKPCLPLPTSVFDRTFDRQADHPSLCRSMLLSTPPKLARSRSSWSMRRTLSPLARTSSGWSLEAPLPRAPASPRPRSPHRSSPRKSPRSRRRSPSPSQRRRPSKKTRNPRSPLLPPRRRKPPHPQNRPRRPRMRLPLPLWVTARSAVSR